MPKVGMGPIRRKQLIDATIECIYQHGLLDTTVIRVSKIAGVSSGIISHYFGSKNGMLEATMREILRVHHQAFSSRLQECEAPQDRVRAIIDANFSSEQTNPAVTCTWLAFWAQSVHVPALARLQNINSRRLYSNLMYSLRQLMPYDEARLAAEGLAALIDGLWLRGALREGGISPEEAQQILLSFCKNQYECN